MHDLADVVAELNAHGMAFDVGWLAPFTEFRFPASARPFRRCGAELRGAIEPWNTLGEEATGPAPLDTSTHRWSACRSASSAPTVTATW